MRTLHADSTAAPSGPAEAPIGHWARRHARAIAVALAVVLFLYDAMYLGVQYGGLGTLSLPGLVALLVLSAGVCALWVLRRRALLRAACVAAVLSCGPLILGVGLTPAPLVVLGLFSFALASDRGWRTGLPAALVLSAWIVVAARPLLTVGYLRIGEVGMLVLAAFFAAMLGLFARSRRRYVDGLRRLNEQLARERDARARIAAAQERTRIAREIHDIVAHSLGTMVVLADGAAQTSARDPLEAGAAMERVRDTGRDALTEMRRMLAVLRSDDPAGRAPQPGLDRLEGLLDAQRSTGLRVDLRVTGTPNARRHGGPLLSLVTVHLHYDGDRVALRIVDDGLDPGASDTDGAARDQGQGGLGVIGMRERATACGGILEAGPRAGGGFEVQAELPYGGAA
jgi:signal transduction histidine kinase